MTKVKVSGDGRMTAMFGELVDTKCLSSVQDRYITLRFKYSRRNVDVTLSSTASVTRWRPRESARLPGSRGLEGGEGGVDVYNYGNQRKKRGGKKRSLEGSKASRDFKLQCGVSAPPAPVVRGAEFSACTR